MRRLTTAVLAAACAAAMLPATTHATPAAATLSGVNGEGSFDDTLSCAQGGDGDSYRYRWEDQPATSALLGGTWTGSFEVHEGFRGAAFVPESDGRLALTLGGADPRRGTAGFDTSSDGSCSDAPLALGTNAEGDPQVTGGLPVVATGGTGALRGLTGTGAIAFALGLGPGADNVAELALTGDLDVADPALAVSQTTARYQNLIEKLQQRVRLSVAVRNSGPGDAYDARVTGVSGGTGRFSGLPTAPQAIPAGQTRTFAVVMDGARAIKGYAISVTTAGRDGLLAPQPPTTTPSSFTTPLLF